MKKILSIFVGVILALGAFSFVGCDKPDEETPPPEPQYQALTVQQFETVTQSFGVIENYLNVLGYKFNGEIVDHATNDVVTLDAKLDMSILEDVALSVRIGVNYDQAGGTGSLINAYLYNQTLYVDYTQDGVVSKDSITGINNDVTEILASFVTGDGGLDVGNVDLGIDTTELDALIEYLKGYLTISYCAELGHYDLKIDYSQGGMYEGENIDPFMMDVDLYVLNNRVTKIEVYFDSAEYVISATISEYNGAIDYPQDASSYNGTILDEIENLMDNADLPESVFYGEWSSDSETLIISEQGVSEDGQTFIEAYSFATYMFYGESTIIMLYPEDETLVVMDLQSGESMVYTKVTA